MASISTRNGRKSIQFVDREGARKTVSLGRVPDDAALAFARWTQSIVDGNRAGLPLEKNAIDWLKSLPVAQNDRLAATGLVRARVDKSKREPIKVVRLAPMIDAYIALRTDIEPSSIQNFEKTRTNLVEFFGEQWDIADINAAQADDWKRWLLTKYKAATVCQRVKRAKTIFKDAVRRELISNSPFADVVGGSDANDENAEFVEQATIERVIGATDDVHWKLVIAMSRYGGVRIPSEIEQMQWRDVDFESKRITVHSKKTRKIQGKSKREMPLFPELEQYLWGLGSKRTA